jgi:hypothetical protein
MTPEAISLWLTPPDHYLWQWDEDGHATWRDGSTIAVREEIAALLSFLAPSGLPPLGSLLLLIMACQGRASQIRSAALNCAAQHPDSGPTAPMARMITTASVILDAISSLPPDLRSTAPTRSRLALFLFGDAPGLRSPDDSSAIVTAFLAAPAAHTRTPLPHAEPAGLRLQRDLRPLAAAQPLATDLANRLTTGIASSFLHPAQLPEPPPDPLLPQLDHHPDPTLRAIATAARLIVAFTSIPLPSGSQGQLPVGGISGITHRGQLDRLLLSELAHDDLNLHARLATGEALFLEREAPHTPTPRHRTILIDSGLHTWGIIRILSLAAAIGLSDSTRRSPTTSVSVLLKTGRRFIPVPLRTPGDLAKVLAELHPDSSTDKALMAWSPPDHPETSDIFLITSDPHPPDCPQTFDRLCQKLTAAGARCFSVLIARSGAVRISRHSSAGTILLSSGQIDPHTLTKPLQQPTRTAPAPTPDPSGLMASLAFYQNFPPPLAFPLAIPADAARTGPSSWAAISSSGFLFHWPQPNAPAHPVARHPLPPANHHIIARDQHHQQWIVTSWPDSPHSHTAFHTIGANGEIYSATAHHPVAIPLHATASKGTIILIFEDHADAFLASDGSPRASLPLPQPITPDRITFDRDMLILLSPDETEHPDSTATPPATTTPPVTMAPPLSAGFDSAGQLILRTTGSRWQLDPAELSWRTTSKVLLAAPRPFRPLPQQNDHPDLPPRFYTAEWHPGCRLVFDTLGVLHLLAAIPSNPIETAVLCVLGQPATPWSRDSQTTSADAAASLAATIRRFSQLARRSA